MRDEGDEDDRRADREARSARFYMDEGPSIGDGVETEVPKKKKGVGREHSEEQDAAPARSRGPAKCFCCGAALNAYRLQPRRGPAMGRYKVNRCAACQDHHIDKCSLRR
ncbi:MAG: hypothetical protein Q7N87_00690 [Candidatus Uhrbacteria bacterium]|nr:hypothetical protein [Candidatus Uhrbacteria bacterium]MDP3793680.1 hypothetical protein [Candidatus Uhrbacteria bacterium]